MRTVKVTFAKRFVPGFDTAYTYKAAATLLEPGQRLWVKTNDGPKQVQIVSVDKEYDTAAEARFGTLAIAYEHKEDVPG